jgi:hypothetical protein
LELAKALPTAARKLQAVPAHHFADNAVVERIVTLVEQRCALTIRRLTEPAADTEDGPDSVNVTGLEFRMSPGVTKQQRRDAISSQPDWLSAPEQSDFS